MRRVALLLLTAFAANASARPPQQVVTGTNTGRETSQTVYSLGAWGGPEIQPTDKAIAVGREMARCAVGRKPDRVRAALDVHDRNEFLTAFNRFSDTVADCFSLSGGAELAVQPSALAGMFAEAWFARSGTPTLAASKYDPNAPKLDFMANGPASLVQLRLAECLSSREPDAVKAFVSVKPGSAEEDAAFGAIIPLIPACLDKNVTLKATRSALRLAMAYALYRRMLEPSAAAEAVAK